MSESGNRVVVQEGYILPFQAYRSGARRTDRSARSVRASPRRPSRRGHGPKSAAYKAQQSKMKTCAKKWRSAGGGSYRSFMSSCLKSRK